MKSMSPGKGARLSCLDRHVLGQGAVAMPVGEAEDPLSHQQPGRAVAEGADHSGRHLPEMDGVRSRPARSAQVEGHSSTVETNPEACT